MTIVTKLGLALPDQTWIERTVIFELDCDSEISEIGFDPTDNWEPPNLLEHAIEVYVSLNDNEVNRLRPSGWWIIHWEWANQ